MSVVPPDSALPILFNGRPRDELRRVGEHAGPLLEQYKLYVQMADRVSARRLAANSFFVSINSAIIALGGYVTVQLHSALSAPAAIAVSLAGVTLCVLWSRLIASYRDLNSVKFQVIHELEKLLPVSPYDAEWQLAGRGEEPHRYLPLTHLERYVPWVFGVLHIIAFLGPLV